MGKERLRRCTRLFWQKYGDLQTMPKKLTIAIDGPVGSGKGTLGIALARRLGALYLYTGGMYRALALACLRKKIDLNNEEKVFEVLRTANIRLVVSNVDTKVFLGEELVNDKIFLPEVSNATPTIAAYPRVRKEMVRKQQKMIKDRSFVVEGRDIATDVVPQADVKIFLTADLMVRAKRRYEQFLEKGIKKTFEEALEDTKKRDRQDTERKIAPLVIAKDAIVINTTNDTIEETVEKAMAKLKEKNLV